MNAVIGTPLSRVDGRAKVTGVAEYAAEYLPNDLLFARMAQSASPAGRIAAIDSTAALAVPGVIMVMTHRNAPRLHRDAGKGVADPMDGERLLPLQDDRVRCVGEPIALVLAETPEAAAEGAAALRVRYAPAAARLSFAREAGNAVPLGPGSKKQGRKTDTARGDAAAALASTGRVDATYVIARENHQPMEPHATVAEWAGGRLVLHDKTQGVWNTAGILAAVFGLPREAVDVISPYVGGAFGSGLRVWPHTILAAMGALAAQRPVKLVLTRRQMSDSVGYRPYTVQRVALGATPDGRLTALRHDTVNETSVYEQYSESVLEASRMLYGCDNVETHYRTVALNVGTPTPMRAPGHATGLFALETAMDELAENLGVDPVELRLRNETTRDADKDLPFSSRSLAECHRIGMQRFGWARRNPRPGSMRDGRQLVGWGMASATYPANRGPSSAKVWLFSNGSAVVQTGASDIGPGTYTSMTQVAAETLGLPPGSVRVDIGDSRLPRAPTQGGSTTMSSVGSAVQAACRDAQARLAALAGGGDAPIAPARWGEVLRAAGQDSVQGEASVAPGRERREYAMHAFGSLFAEVAVDPDFGLVRVRRLLGVYAAGRIVNPKTARSQIIGGMVQGIGMALLEHAVVDERWGRVLTGNLGEYLMPVNADVRGLEVVFLPEEDRYVNPIGAKGIGEIAVAGVAPAIANAVSHATGRRQRQLPIAPEMLI